MTKRGLKEFLAIIARNRTLLKVLKSSAATIYPQPWCVFGGSVYQTVWNASEKERPEHNIDDYDIAYFDRRATVGQQREHEARISKLVPHAKVQVRNQALITDAWWMRRFKRKKDTPKHLSLEDSIAKGSLSLPIIGIAFKNDELQVLELSDDLDKLLTLEIYPNVKFRPQSAFVFGRYRAKCKTWHDKWPNVKYFGTDRKLMF